MTRRLLIECGAAETRAALLHGEEIIRFWFGPARGDEHFAAPQRGDRFSGRVRRVSKPLQGAFVDIGEGPEGFLPFGKEKPPHEGAAIAVTVSRPALGSKGPLLTLSNDAASGVETAPARIGEPRDAAVQAAEALGAVDEISIDSAEAAALLRGGEARVAVTDARLETSDVTAAIDAALERTLTLDTGVRMIFDETEAVTAIDIDAGSAAEGATGKLNDKANAAAASRLFGELSRRGIGGRVVVDFLPPSGAPARQDLMEQLRAAKRGIYECRLGRLSADGLFDLTAPRRRPSLLEQASEPAGNGWARTGRRFTLGWQAKAAIRALETALREQPSRRLRLVAGAALNAYLMQNPQWPERLALRYGARAELAGNPSMKDRDFEIA